MFTVKVAFHAEGQRCLHVSRILGSYMFTFNMAFHADGQRCLHVSKILG